MPKLNTKKVLMIGGGAVAAFLAFNWWSKRSAAQAAQLKAAESAAAAAKASGASTQSIVSQLVSTPAVQEQLAKGEAVATSFVKSLLGKLGIG